MSRIGTTIDGYMNHHRDDPNANELKDYFQEVFKWVKEVFPDYTKYMKGLPWGEYYNEFHKYKYDSDEFRKEVERLIKEDIADSEVTVIIAKRPCELLKKGDKPVDVITDCRGCGKCLKLGCPALVKTGKFVTVDATLCVGCGLCEDVCPFHAIGKKEK